MITSTQDAQSAYSAKWKWASLYFHLGWISLFNASYIQWIICLCNEHIKRGSSLTWTCTGREFPMNVKDTFIPFPCYHIDVHSGRPSFAIDRCHILHNVLLWNHPKVKSIMFTIKYFICYNFYTEKPFTFSWEKHRITGRTLVRVTAILHWRVWLQRICHQHSSEEAVNHIWEAVDVQMHRHWRYLWNI